MTACLIVLLLMTADGSVGLAGTKVDLCPRWVSSPRYQGRPAARVPRLHWANCWAFGPTDFLGTGEEAVESGRNALGRWRRREYPWYDSSSDDLRRVELAPEREPQRSAPPREPLVTFSHAPLEVLAWIVLALVLGAVVFLLARAFLNRTPDISELGDGSVDGDADRIEALPFPVAAGRLDLLAEARRQYEAGNFGQAIIFLFSYQLVQLDRRQIIRLARGKTNRQYLREVGPRARLMGLVEQTMVAFEDVFFGNRTLDRTRFESCWSALPEFETLAGEGAA
jgi:hypothetical protein